MAYCFFICTTAAFSQVKTTVKPYDINEIMRLVKLGSNKEANKFLVSQNYKVDNTYTGNNDASYLYINYRKPNSQDYYNLQLHHNKVFGIVFATNSKQEYNAALKITLNLGFVLYYTYTLNPDISRFYRKGNTKIIFTNDYMTDKYEIIIQVGQ